eukprot:TRINITY_DN105669_c0_g1_i1.p1 TRINITY_DN105669_c0_g1~~TRINITY_DN105669_c0_g1_i1.p1  ORF type:complete len:178 (-),score=35.97 TRINITY_DN105669_c0_g1_i1:62-595(-)
MPITNPYHADLVHKQTIEKELEVWCCQQLGIQSDASLESLQKGHAEELANFRVPDIGQQVIITGSRHRPELNGAHAEVLSRSADSSGRVTIRVFDSLSRKGAKGSRRMQIRACNLVPIQMSSEAPVHSGASDVASVRSCSSRAGSVGGRSLFSQTARSALSGSASLLKLPALSEVPG